MATYRMAGIWRDPRTSVCYFRKGVPAELRPYVGGLWELKVSLRTKDPKVAKHRYPVIAAEADRRLQEARQALAQQRQDIALGASLDELDDAFEAAITPAWRQWDYARRHGGVGDPKLEPVGLLDEEPAQWRRGHAPVAPHHVRPQAAAVQVSLSGLLQDWATERRPPGKTLASWETIINRLIAHVGHDDAERLMRRDIVGWKDQLLTTLSPKSVEVHLAAVSTIFNHAIINERVTRTDNPVKGVRVAAKKDPSEQRRPFTDDEATLVLGAAESDPRPSMRFLPVLLAYTGARLDELCGLTKADVRFDQAGGWFIRIEPTKDRSLKTPGSARSVPLHEAVLEAGFMGYVQSLEDTPETASLWPDLKKNKWGSRGGTATNLLGRRLRKLGINDPRVVAGHSWRHRFKDQCRAAGIPKDQHDALTGHVAGDVGSTYGLGHNLKTLREAIDKLT